jgi:hypothetical protein
LALSVVEAMPLQAVIYIGCQHPTP